jgi:phage terminase Nu1 subunit (DNA packaging protein)
MSNAEPILAQFFTKEELAAELGRNMRTLDRWEVLGIGPPRTLVGRKILYRRMSVQRWLAAQENQVRSDRAAAERSSARELRGSL